MNIKVGLYCLTEEKQRMLRNKGKSRSWHLFWKVPDDETLEQLELFVRLSIIQGVHHTQVLTEMVRVYNAQFIESTGLSEVTLVDEKVLLERLKPCTPVSRVLLSQYRASRKLVPKSGLKPLFWTDGRRVVYNLEGCKAFFSELRAA